jgi:drug/metabolite transporter superfamily protein YnfA
MLPAAYSPRRCGRIAAALSTIFIVTSIIGMLALAHVRIANSDAILESDNRC